MGARSEARAYAEDDRAVVARGALADRQGSGSPPMRRLTLKDGGPPDGPGFLRFA